MRNLPHLAASSNTRSSLFLQNIKFDKLDPSQGRDGSRVGKRPDRDSLYFINAVRCGSTARRMLYYSRSISTLSTRFGDVTVEGSVSMLVGIPLVSVDAHPSSIIMFAISISGWCGRPSRIAAAIGGSD